MVEFPPPRCGFSTIVAAWAALLARPHPVPALQCPWVAWPRMAQITVKLPDDTELELSEGATGADAAAAIGPRLAEDALAVRWNCELPALAAPLYDGERIEIVTPGRPDALDVLRHYTA